MVRGTLAVLFAPFHDMVGFPGGSDGKESTCNTEDPGSIPGSGRSPGEWQPTPVFLSGNFHEQRSLVGYSSWGRKELDTTDQPTLSLWCSGAVRTLEVGPEGVLRLQQQNNRARSEVRMEPGGAPPGSNWVPEEQRHLGVWIAGARSFLEVETLKVSTWHHDMDPKGLTAALSSQRKTRNKQSIQWHNVFNYATVTHNGLSCSREKEWGSSTLTNTENDLHSNVKW